MCHLIQNSSFCGGVGAVLLHFSIKDFEILDFYPPNNPTSHYVACHFGYSLALRSKKILDKDIVLCPFDIKKPLHFRVQLKSRNCQIWSQDIFDFRD